MAYRTAIFQNQIGLLYGRLVYYEQNSFASKDICRIVVSLSLCHAFFNLMYASPVARYIDFWPRIRTDIKKWIQ